jgi:periplasmic protein CpxP/Spy
MNKNGLKYVVGIALLVNALTLGFLLFRKPHRPPVPEDILVKALKFDVVQQEKFETLRAQDRDLRHQFSEQIKAVRIKQYQNISTDADSTTAAIGRIYAALERNNVQHLMEVRKLCRPEQQVLFDKLLIEMVEMPFKKEGHAPHN